MQYAGDYSLDLDTGTFTGDGVFVIVGGTGRFAGASGVVLVHVVVTAPPVNNKPIPFDYEFDGFIVLNDE